MLEKIKSRIAGLVFACMAICLGLMPSVASAQDSGALDTSNFDTNVTDFVATTASAFAALVAACLGVYFLIQIVRGGMKWIRSYVTK